MDRAARLVLKKRKGYIVNNLILSDETLDCLEEKGVLTDEMTQDIKAGRTPNEKIYKLLFILTRRGPDAFDVFVEALRANNGFLSETLESDYIKELENCTADSDDSSRESNSPDLVQKNLTEQAVQTNTFVCSRCSIKAVPFMEKTDTDMSNSEAINYSKQMMQDAFRHWYNKLKFNMTTGNLREASFKSPQPVSYDMVDQLIDQLINILNTCYRVLGVKDNLVTQVIYLKESKRKLKLELKQKGEERNKFANNIIKLENKCRDYHDQIESIRRQNQRLHSEMLSLQEETELKLKKIGEEVEKQVVKYEETLNKLRLSEEKLKDALAEIENLDGCLLEYERNTGKYNWQIQGAKFENCSRSNSRNNTSFDNRCRPKNTTTTRKYKHSMQKESNDFNQQETGITTQDTKKEEDTDELTAVEEPDSQRLKRTESLIELCCKRSTAVIIRQTECDNTALSNDKTLNEDSRPDQLQNSNQGNNLEEQKQQMIVSNSSNANEKTTTGIALKRSHSKRLSFNRGRRNSTTPAASQLQPMLGVSGMNVKGNRDSRQVLGSTQRVLDTLVINNSKTASMHESPRGPKSMKKHHQ